MSNNPYQTPQGELTHRLTPSESSGLYAVSQKKFIALFVTTAGFYLTYWFYRNWQLQKRANELKIWPLPRAIFAIFFTHALFRNVNRQRNLVAAGLPEWKYNRQATIIVFLFLIGYVADGLSSQWIGYPLTDYLSSLLLLPILARFISVQNRINEACGDPLGESNRRFSGTNYFWMAVGLLIWILIGINISLPLDYAA